MEKTTKPGLLIPLIVAIAISLYVGGFFLFAAGLPRPPLSVNHADGIVALTGGGERLDAAVSLLEHKVGKRLLISGVHPTTTKADLKRLSHGGARFDCCVDLGFSAANTRGNASETASWTRAHHYRSLIVVTARYHMPRTLAEFAADMPNVRLEPYPVEPDGVDLARWWLNPHTLRLLYTEYSKYLASLVITRFSSSDESRAT